MRPKFDLEWATEPPNPGDVQAPPVSFQRTGWPFQHAIPYQWRNALDNLAAWAGRQLARHGGAGFSALEDALADHDAPLEVGDTCLIDEDDAGHLPATVADVYASGEDVVAAISATARSVFLLAHEGSPTTGVTPLQLVRLNRDGTPNATAYAVAGVFGGVDVYSDGQYVAVGSHEALEVFDHDTGVLLWTAPLTQQSRRRITGDHRHIYVTDGSGAYAFTRDAGVASPFPGTSDDIFDIATDGVRLYGARPNDLVVWDIDSATVDGTRALTASDGAAMCADGHHVYIAALSGAAELALEARQLETGSTIWQVDLERWDGAADVRMSSVQALVHDGDFLWLIAGNAWWKIDPANGQIRAHGQHASNAVDVAADGCAVWVALANGSVARVRRGNRKRLWRRVDPSAAFYLPLHQEMVPA